ncbi:hypothetical protein P2G88_03630 [Aliiglaciecola sp. CAU 1673]|uniref:L,D-transpeptidase family protein n=1 Tax=Aliiglaciecola sp. CAU 1673 TaxID=3032595 RepID=UPI0023D97ABB|nr:hypothetical protein [Aliiglaciecola sp. CAU 1673]MDF2177334.1 hypothetical protein [Aliiglaciecola sp. CAU 1673]
MLQQMMVMSLRILAICVSASAVADWQLPEDSQQLIVVTSDDWYSYQGDLMTFEKEGGEWLIQSTRSKVTLGRNGIAWGLGLQPPQPGIQKHEGDGRSPAGVFSLGTAFGYQPFSGLKVPYLTTLEHDFCVDVPDSPYYNQIVDFRQTGPIEGVTEPMRRDLAFGDGLYRLGMEVRHNPNNLAGAGSCIFLHVWRDANAPTAGCTAMPAQVMRKLLMWMDKDKKPLFVLLPRQQYVERELAWGLPPLY